MEKRKYKCFVCGKDFTDYDTFQQHIKDEHEISKEYVLCSFCDAPVRDLRLHYKVKHKGITCPKNGQMRAIVWYDFSTGKRKRDKKKVQYNEGYFTSAKNGFKEMHHRSGYELEVYKVLEELNEVISYEVEPMDCVTPYFWGGEYKRYWPDLKIKFADGHTEVWEIKPMNQKDDPQNQAKWHACADFVGKRGHIFAVKTEQGIAKLKNKLEQQKNRTKE